MNQAQENKKLNIICDRLCMFGFCMMMFIWPISNALMESSFSFIWLPFLVKKSYYYFSGIGPYALDLKNKSLLTNLYHYIKIFIPDKHPLNKPIGWFVAVVFITIFFSINPMLSLAGYIFSMLQGVFTFYICMEIINSQKRLRLLMIIFLFITTLMTVNGIVQYRTGEGFVRHFSSLNSRAQSAFKHPNDFATYLIMVIPVLFSLSVIGYDQFKNKSGDIFTTLFQSTPVKILATVILVLSISCLGHTFSRGAWLGFLSSLIFLSFLNKRKTISYCLIGITFLVIFYQPLKSVRDVSFLDDKVALNKKRESMVIEKMKVKGIDKNKAIVKQRFDSIKSFSGMGRKKYWKEAINVFIRHPFTGSGLKTYREAGKIYNHKWSFYHAHNCYLEMLAEIGIFGLLTFLWIIYSIFRFVLKNLKKFPDSPYYYLTCGFLIGIFGYLFHAIFDTNFYSTKLSTFFWFDLGLLMAVVINFLRQEPAGN